METQDFLISIGKIIRARRKALKLSQEQLAERASLHPTYISEIERGKVNASVYCFYTIAQALGLEFADFLFLPENAVNRRAIIRTELPLRRLRSLRAPVRNASLTRGVSFLLVDVSIANF